MSMTKDEFHRMTDAIMDGLRPYIAELIKVEVNGRVNDWMLDLGEAEIRSMIREVMKRDVTVDVRVGRVV